MRASVGLLCVSLTISSAVPDAAVAEEMPARLAFGYTGEVWSNVRGGLQTGGRYLDKWDLLVDWQMRGLPVVGDARLHVHALSTNGAGLTDDLVGDLQHVSNIDAPGAVRVLEAWYEKSVSARRSLRFGLYDLNSEFDASETAKLFVNSSHGIAPDLSQSGANGPSIFPVTGLALRVMLPLADTVDARIALLDAVPGDPDDPRSHSLQLNSEEGALLIAELDSHFGETTRLYFGGWCYTRRAMRLLADASGTERSRAAGGYFGAEAAFSGGLSGFVRVGLASEAVHAVARYTGAGLSWQRDTATLKSSLGLAIAHARSSSEYRRLLAQNGARASSAETALELTARVELPSGLALQPDLQYVLNPGADAALQDALVFGLRFEWRMPSPISLPLAGRSRRLGY